MNSEDSISLINDSSLDLLGGATMKILDKNNLLNKEKLVMTPYSYLLHLKLTPSVISEAKAMLGEDISGGEIKFMTAYELFKQKEKFQKIIFNVHSLDQLTEGGIDVGVVTEIYGEAGCGKTQLCMQLALNCGLPTEFNGLNGRTCYVSTDKPFPVKRLAQMAEGSRYATHDINFLDIIHVWEYYTLDELQFFIKEDLHKHLQIYPIRLVIIDSWAGIFRVEAEYIKRARDMRELINELLRLSNSFNFAIVITNHITSYPQADGTTKNESALGQAWNNLTDVKLSIEKTRKFFTSNKVELSRVSMKVIHSPRLPVSKANFTIDSTGL